MSGTPMDIRQRPPAADHKPMNLSIGWPFGSRIMDKDEYDPKVYYTPKKEEMKNEKLS